MDQGGIDVVIRYLQEQLGGCMINVYSAQDRDAQRIELVCDENPLILEIRKILLEGLSPADLAEALKEMGLAEHLRAKRCMIVQDRSMAVEC